MSFTKYKPTKKDAGKKLTSTKRRKSKVKRALIKRLGKQEGRKAFQLATTSRDKLKSDLNVRRFDDVLREVYERKIAQALVRTSHAKYHEAIGLALALYYAVLATENPEATLKRLIKETDQKPTKRTSAAQIVVQAVINYGETKKERQANRRVASRDAAAVSYLAEHGISPDEVVDLGKKKGEGLEAWAGAKPCIKPRKKASDANGVIDGKSAEPRDQSEDAIDEWDEQEQEDDRETSEAINQNRTRQLGAIKEIARNGHVFFRAPDEDETWGVVTIKLTVYASRADSELRKILADALREYADQLTN
jgi:hypothetical protein